MHLWITTSCMQVASLLMPTVLQHFSRKQIDIGLSSKWVVVSLGLWAVWNILCLTFCVFNECTMGARAVVLVLFSTCMSVCKDMFNYVEMRTICVQVEEEAREEIEAWEKDHGRTFLVEGVPFVQYIERQWTTFREQKELEKQERVSKKPHQPPAPISLPLPPKNNCPPCRNRSYLQNVIYIFVARMNIYIWYVIEHNFF